MFEIEEFVRPLRVKISYEEGDEEYLNKIPFFSGYLSTRQRLSKSRERRITVRVPDKTLFTTELAVEAFFLYFHLILNNDVGYEEGDFEWTEELFVDAKDYFVILEDYIFVSTDDRPYPPREFFPWMKRMNFVHYYPSDYFYDTYLKEDEDIYDIYLRDKTMRRGETSIDLYVLPNRMRRRPISYEDKKLIARNKVAKNIISSSVKTSRIVIDLEDVMDYPTDKRFFPFLDTLRAITRISNVVVCGGSIESILTLIGNERRVTRDLSKQDIDVFIYGNVDIEKKVMEVISNMASVSYNFKISMNDNVIQLLYKGIESTVVVQIIRRLYPSIGHVLLGSDLDSSSVGMASIDGNREILFTERFHFAFEHKLNVINPYRQSASYNARLKKYFDRGYSVYVPGSLHLLNNNYLTPIYTGKHIPHHFSDLLMKLYPVKKLEVKLPEEDYLAITPRDIVNIEQDINVGYFARYINQDHIGDILRAKPEEAREVGVLGGLTIEGVIERIKFWELSMEEYSEIFSEEILDRLEDHYISKIKDKVIFTLPWREDKIVTTINKVLREVNAFDNWMTENPGTQITGTFHPTDIDYFSLDI